MSYIVAKSPLDSLGKIWYNKIKKRTPDGNAPSGGNKTVRKAHRLVHRESMCFFAIKTIFSKNERRKSYEEKKKNNRKEPQALILLTCFTADDYDVEHINNETPVNIVEQLVLSDAETVLGFEGSTVVGDCDRFIGFLMERKK